MALEAQDNPFTYITLVDTADPTTPDAGTKRLWVDTDDVLKIIDEADVVSTVGDAAAPTGTPVIEANGFAGSSTTSLATTISAAAAGKRLLVVVFSNARDVNTPTCTNVTFTEVLASVFSTTCFLSVYVGVVAGGSSGTTVTTTATGSNVINVNVDTIADLLTPTAGTPATVNNTDAAAIAGTLLGPITPTRGVFWVAAGAQVTNTTPLLFRANVPFTSRFVRSTLASGAQLNFAYGFGYAPGGEIIAWTEGGTSGADYAGGIVQVT